MKIISVGITLLLIFMMVPQGCGLAQEPVTVRTASSTAAPCADKISLDIKGMDILDVFRILSMRAGLNIITGKNVSGKVTLFLKDVDIWDAFEMVIAANGLAYEKRGDIIYVMTERDYELIYGKKYEDRRIVKSIRLKYVKAQDIIRSVSELKTNIGRVVADETSGTIVLMDIPETVAEMEKLVEKLDVSLTTKVYALQYATAEKIKDKLTEMLTKNVGSLRIDERTNKIVITDVDTRLPLFDKVIAAFDEKHREVLIEAKILQVTLNNDYNMGINWDAVFANTQKKIHRIATLGVNLKYGEQTAIIPTTTGTGKGGALQIGELESEGYEVVIQALKQYGQTNLLSSPRIVALNNQEAKILVGTNQPYATRSISQTSGGASNIEAENVTFLDLGVKLNVTPTINADNYITMKIKPEVSSTTSTYVIKSSNNEIPVVKTTTTETTVMVKDGATILIGGLIEDREAIETRETPGLADIPLLGAIFRSKTRGSGNSSTPEKTELVVFLTPHIITGDALAPDFLTVEKVAHETAINKIKQQAELMTDRQLQNAVKDVSSFDMLPEDYYDLISIIITKKVESYKPLEPIYGKAIISFILDRDGQLISKPEVYSSDNSVLSDIGIRSIKEAAPFPAFPRYIYKDKETFQITISYE